VFYGIGIDRYIEKNKRLCRYWSNKQCPCVADEEKRKLYDRRYGPWVMGVPLFECENCTMFIPPRDVTAEYPKHMTNAERALWPKCPKRSYAVKKEAKIADKLVKVTLLSANGGTMADRAARIKIGEEAGGAFDALLGCLASDADNVTLIFKLDYADGRSEVVAERATSKRAKTLLRMTNQT